MAAAEASAQPAALSGPSVLSLMILPSLGAAAYSHPDPAIAQPMQNADPLPQPPPPPPPEEATTSAAIPSSLSTAPLPTVRFPLPRSHARSLLPPHPPTPPPLPPKGNGDAILPTPCPDGAAPVPLARFAEGLLVRQILEGALPASAPPLEEEEGGMPVAASEPPEAPTVLDSVRHGILGALGHGCSVWGDTVV